MTTEMDLDALPEPVRCAVLTERLPKELREKGVRVTSVHYHRDSGVCRVGSNAGHSGHERSWQGSVNHLIEQCRRFGTYGLS